VAPGGKVRSARRPYETVSLETLAPGGGKVPPGGLGLCCLAVLGVAPAGI